jgi:hypothetical protein
LNTLTSQETTEYVRERYNDLPPESKVIVDALVKQLVKGFKKRAAERERENGIRVDVKFGPDSALELIFALRDGMDNGTIRLKDSR